ncbi:MAG TPA: HDOD domain-containing protein [Candidatus Hydrogenedentes bacterium]|nr:HDOD domain-containing protein [Candidatus Hydrogenedentota bacterium]
MCPDASPEPIRNVDFVRRKVQDLATLPTLPGIVRAVVAMMDNADAGPRDVAELVSHDQVMSAKILRLVNSPLYGFPGRISSVSHALVLLGFNVVRGLVLSMAVFDHFSSRVPGLWGHSLGTALVARALARQLGRKDAEEVMIAALLHDLGKVVLAHLFPEHYAWALSMASERRCHVSEAEREVFSVDHTLAGAWISQAWHLPARVEDVMVFHHTPRAAKNAPPDAALAQLADALARAMEYGDPGDPVMPRVDADAINSLGLADLQVSNAIKIAEVEFRQGVDVLAGGTPNQNGT